ncbi:MAG: histone deacetylase [Anaerolineales bacterium]|nr:histone deacetylase [Anaerolineales bacterium]
MTTVYTFVPSRSHQFPEHPERPARLDAVEPQLGLCDAEKIESKRATQEQVARVHAPKLIQTIAEVCKRGASVIDSAPTYVAATSYDDALLAAGGAIQCTQAVLNGEAINAFAIVRPPGHHAEPQRAMGFCLFNNVAIAVQEALANGLERALVIDYDAHHGNGTQQACLHDERFGFISTHQWGIYPGTGWMNDAPHATGRLVNVPLHSRAGDKTFSRIHAEIFEPLARKFKPQMLFISAGFDAHWTDPLTKLGVSTQGFYAISQRLVALAEELCGGRIVFVLEGGYDLQNVAHGVDAVFGALTHSPLKFEARDLSPHPEPDCSAWLGEIRALHQLA